ncbi:MAG TPA: thiol:disulfide interchange protein [Deltaproteobacteria bacterium]|nr:thiol:disulfide interchange protein [Deltaproteobacteria bacterium]
MTLPIRVLACLGGLLLWLSGSAGLAVSPPDSPAKGIDPAERLELASLPGSARTLAVFEDDAPQLEARLLVSSGPERRIGILFDLAPGWHVYWRNPGETGIAPRLGLEAAGHRVGQIVWPTPRTFREADGLFTTWGYEGRVLLSAPIEPIPDDAHTTGSGLATNGIGTGDGVRAKTTALICRTQCVPASFTLSTPLDPGLSASDQRSIDALFREAEASEPRVASALGLEAEAFWTGSPPTGDEVGRVELALRSCPEGEASCRPPEAGNEEPLFIPIDAESLEFSKARVLDTIEPDRRYAIAMEAVRLADQGGDRLRGLLRLSTPSRGTEYVEVDVPILERQAGSPAAAPPASDAISGGRWLQIFLLALIGGLILNGMPCVLPVLAIKVVAVADLAEKDPREVRLHGLAYTAGVLGSMAILAAIVVGLRAAGHSVGWGFQFQEPLFVAGISALLVAFALNLFGVYEIEFGQGRLAAVGQDATGLRRSVFEGLLAVVLATPCTAPFLGTAVGFAFATSGFGIAAIFLAIGAGLASPFLAVSFFPRLARFIPRSGPWMMKLRAGLGFSLLATVVWLLYVLGQSGGATAVVAMTGNLLFLAFLLWIFGQLQPIRRVWLGRLGAVAITGLAFAGFNLIDFDRAGAAAPARMGTQTGSEWRVWSEEAVAEALSEGHPVFVDFTADWCLTCQVNERTVLGRPAILEAFRNGGYVLFKADWTRRNEAIRRKLAEFGRAGVPLYLVYSPDAPERPRILSELLSRREVLSALARSRWALRD